MFDKGWMNAGEFAGKNGGEKIQAAMDAFGEKRKVIFIGPEGPDQGGIWKISKTLRIPSNTTLILSGTKLMLENQVNDNILRNAKSDLGDDSRDTNIHIIGLGQAEIDGNGSMQTRQEAVHWNFGIHFHKVDHSSVQGITLGPTNAWGTSFEDVNDLIVDRICFNQDGLTTNQDGVHVCGPGSHITISNIVGTIADDAIAVDACACVDDPRGNCFGSGGLLTGVVINNVSVNNVRDGAVLRTVAGKGKPLDGVYASNLVIKSSNQVLKIGWARFGLRERFGVKEGYDAENVYPTAEEHKNIYIDGVQGSTEDTFCVIESDVKNLTIKGVRGKCGNAAFTNSGSGNSYNLENVLLEDWKLDGAKTAVEISGESRCKGLTVRDCRFVSGKDTDHEDAKEANSMGMYFSGKGKTLDIEEVSVDNVTFEDFKTGIRVDDDVRMLDRINLKDVCFLNADKECDLLSGALLINGIGQENMDNNSIKASSRWKVGDMVEFCSDDAAGRKGLYLLIAADRWVKLAE